MTSTDVKDSFVERISRFFPNGNRCVEIRFLLLVAFPFFFFLNGYSMIRLEPEVEIAGQLKRSKSHDLRFDNDSHTVELNKAHHSGLSLFLYHFRWMMMMVVDQDLALSIF